MPAGMANQHRSRAAAVATALLALVLQLAWPTPLPVVAQLDLAAAYGEHALCLSKTPGSDPASPLPVDRPPPAAPAQHSDHAAAGCCPWHIGGGVILPVAGTATRIAFAIRAEPFIAAATPPPGRHAIPAQARAPPPPA